MAAPNLFQDLKQALMSFREFLHENIGVIKPAVQALRDIVPQVGELITKLIALMNSLKTEISNLNPGVVEGLEKVSQFTTGITNLLTSAKNLLPNQSDEIDDVLSVTSVVSSLPSFDQVKQELLDLIDAIVADLNQLNQ